MRAIVKSLWLVLLPALLLAAGCGGINASRTVSPLDFLMPGLLQADPPAQPPDREWPDQTPAALVA